MTRIINAKKKLSRRYETNLWGRDNDTFTKRNYRPGEHGADTHGKLSDYKVHLLAKQKIRYFYGLKEKQFKNLFKIADASRQDTILSMIQLLESRLDSIVYRANFVPTMFAAKQLINHKHILVNGRVMNIQSCRLRPGDVVEVKDKSKNMLLVHDALERMERDVPVYLKLDKDACKVEYLSTPLVGDVVYPFTPEFNFIVEFYSK